MAKTQASVPASATGDTFDVLIAGGGPIGMTLALALARRGFRTALADAGQAAAPGRAFLVAAGCWRIWKALGVEVDLFPHAEAVTSVEAGSGAGGIAFLSSDCAADATELGYMIEEGPLTAVLRAALEREADAAILSPVRIGAPEIGDAWASVDAGGRTIRARLVVGCDGVRSAIRQAAGIRFSGRDYPAKALSTVLKLDAPHHGAARQVFLSTGPVAALPLKADSKSEWRVNLVWSHRAAVADALAAMSAADFEAELARATDGFLEGFRLDGARHAFPLGVHVADRLHAPRIALAGDAAHQIHPLAGQGLNLGLKDVAALVDVIAEADRVGLDIGSEGALAPYTKWRRADIVAQAAAMDGFAMAFSGSAPVRALAGLGMAAAGQAPMLRRAFAREAAGEGGDTPSLMRA